MSIQISRSVSGEWAICCESLLGTSAIKNQLITSSSTSVILEHELTDWTCTYKHHIAYFYVFQGYHN
jgi:hypothetical protein